MLRAYARYSIDFDGKEVATITFSLKSNEEGRKANRLEAISRANPSEVSAGVETTKGGSTPNSRAAAAAGLKTESDFKRRYIRRGNPRDPLNRERLRSLLGEV